MSQFTKPKLTRTLRSRDLRAPVPEAEFLQKDRPDSILPQKPVISEKSQYMTREAKRENLHKLLQKERRQKKNEMRKAISVAQQEPTTSLSPTPSLTQTQTQTSQYQPKKKLNGHIRKKLAVKKKKETAEKKALRKLQCGVPSISGKETKEKEANDEEEVDEEGGVLIEDVAFRLMK